MNKTKAPKFSKMMNLSGMECAALGHAEEERRYQATPQAAKDLETDKRRRATADVRNGHVPTCTLTKCAPNCRKAV